MGAMNTAAGTPQLAGIVSPSLFSGILTVKYYQLDLVSKIANTNYEGEIKQLGSEVVIRKIGDTTVRPYTKNGVTTMENIQPSKDTLEINKGQYFYGKIDSVDEFQSDMDYAEKYAEDGVQVVRKVVNDDVFAVLPTTAAAANAGTAAGLESGDIDLGVTGAPLSVTASNILDLIVERAGVVADEQNWPEDERWLVVPAWMAGRLKNSDLKNASVMGDPKSVLRNAGRLGMIDRFEVYATNSIKGAIVGAHREFNVTFGHKAAFTFAQQFVETVYFDKLEGTAGKAVRSIMVYGHKTLNPAGIGRMVVRKG